MDRISVNRFSFRRKGSHKKDKQKHDGHANKIEEVQQQKIKYIRYDSASKLKTYIVVL
jgi:hypothetical protein